MGFRISRSQKIVIACALIGLGVLLLIVPYRAVHNPGDLSQISGSVGYHFILTPPDTVACEDAVGRSLRQNRAVSVRLGRSGCRNYLNGAQLTVSVFAYVCGVLAILVLMSVNSERRSSKPIKPVQFRYGEGGSLEQRATIPGAPTPIM